MNKPLTDNQIYVLNQCAVAERYGDYLDLRRLTDWNTLRSLERRDLVVNVTEVWDVDGGTAVRLTEAGREELTRVVELRRLLEAG